MKISIDIECSPEEARTFLGLPDVAGMQQSMTQMVQEKMTEHFTSMDPEAMMKTWLPSGVSAWEKMQESFMAQFSGEDSGAGEKKK